MMIRRRAFIRILAAGASLVTLRSFAQRPGKVFRVGYLSLLSPDPASPGGVFFRGVRDELAKRGYVVGSNVVFEQRYALGHADQLPALAADLVQMDLDVIMAGPASAIRAALNATSKIPIVMAFSGDDPVTSGFVKSLAKPGGNVTGITAQVRDIAPKWVQLLREIAPHIERVAVLANPAQVEHAGYLTAMRDTLPAGIRLQRVEVLQPGQYEVAFKQMNEEHAQALIILGNVIFTQDSGPLANLALTHRLPSIYLFREFPDSGGLMSYGPDHHEIFNLAAEYVDKILRGTKPSELPVQQPTKFDLIVNDKTAKALGLTLSPLFLARATEIIR